MKETKMPDHTVENTRGWWNENPCDSEHTTAGRYSREYFEELEEHKYLDQPFIHGFAQFTRYHGKQVLEVGHGPGADFVQWLRAGARATGIDLTPEAHEHVKRRIEVYGLPQPEALVVGSAEELPFESDTFDLGYSFGVLHHTADTEGAIRELVRVIKPGGDFKIMLYNRHSIYIFNQWIKHGLLKGKPFRSLVDITAEHIENPGTKAYTARELEMMLGSMDLEEIRIDTEITSADEQSAQAFPPLNWLNRILLRLCGPGLGFYHDITARKKKSA